MTRYRATYDGCRTWKNGTETAHTYIWRIYKPAPFGGPTREIYLGKYAANKEAFWASTHNPEERPNNFPESWAR